jgi:hypothetical protein
MAAEIELQDDAGRPVAALSMGTERSYVLPDGSRCTVPQAAAWCRDCEGYVVAEEVPPMEYVEKRLAALRAGPQAYEAWARSVGEQIPPQMLGPGWAGYQAWALKYWESVRAWRALRQSAARCLQCFSTEIEPLPRGVHVTQHPLTGQRLTLRIGTRGSTPDRWEYSPEGLPFEG